MSYAAIHITEVGSAEYPLLSTLRDSIFGPAGHRFSLPIDAALDGQRDALALIAHLEGNPVGFKIGFRSSPIAYHSWVGGVLPDYRRQGVAGRMQEWQHAFARSRGYKSVYFNTFNRFREMMIFGLDSGFLPVAVERRPEGELSIKFSKDLSSDAKVDVAPAAQVPAGRGFIDHTDVPGLRGAITAGFDIVGMIHSGRSTQIIVEP
jgi:GNAT superfamily N-acetyltransferase